MKVSCTVSLGELIDKLTILELKIANIEQQDKVATAKKEHFLLSEYLETLKLDGLNELREQLKVINGKLWVIEDDIRDKERASEFDTDFIELARSVYIVNDERFNVKNLINIRYNSDVKEVKSYKEY